MHHTSHDTVSKQLNQRRELPNRLHCNRVREEARLPLAVANAMLVATVRPALGAQMQTAIAVVWENTKVEQDRALVDTTARR